MRAQLRHGAVLRLEDLLLRRVRLAMWDPAAARAVAPRLAELCAAELAWASPRREAEEASLSAALTGWTLEGVR